MTDAKETLPARPTIPVPGEARRLDERIAVALGELIALGAASALEGRFRVRWARVLGLFERYQQAVVAASPCRVRCAPGCAHCCSHWVDDVYSFEVDILADHLRRAHPAELPGWLESWRSDRRELDRLLELHGSLEAALAAFPLAGRVCALAGPLGACRVYPLRPLTCRAFLSFSEPRWCQPGHARHGQASTYLLLPGGRSDRLLDELDLQFRESGANGLADQLLRALEPDRTVGSREPRRLEGGVR
jgi:Fe-S-cluster containining protein